MSYLKSTTCFVNNAIGIDPVGCGCMDCIVGDSIPVDQVSTIEDLLREHWDQDREIINRDHQTMLIYKSFSGNPVWESINGTDVEILPEETYYPMDYDAEAEDPIIIIHPPYHVCDSCRSGESIPADSGRKFTNAYRRYLNGSTLYNMSDSVLVVFKELWEDDEYEVISINTSDPDSVEVLTD
ncbi:MAG: hypothetical protein H9W81_10125 [Enterococcus sp.]|nr:hypothetical protein [Enterococcus sp.]